MIPIISSMAGKVEEKAEAREGFDGKEKAKVPGNENVNAKYSISNILPGEEIVYFPDKDAYPRTQPDLDLLHNKFN